MFARACSRLVKRRLRSALQLRNVISVARISLSNYRAIQLAWVEWVFSVAALWISVSLVWLMARWSCRCGQVYAERSSSCWLVARRDLWFTRCNRNVERSWWYRIAVYIVSRKSKRWYTYQKILRKFDYYKIRRMLLAINIWLLVRNIFILIYFNFTNNTALKI